VFARIAMARFSLPAYPLVLALGASLALPPTPGALAAQVAADPLLPAAAAPTAADPGLQPPARELVLDRQARQLRLMEAGQMVRRYAVAVGRPGWETPVGRFQVLEMTMNPIWQHPANGRLVPPGPSNPLGSRWIGFYRDCSGRRGFNGQQNLVVKGCAIAGFHGTPNHRWTVGRAVSHGCVRLFEENVQEVFELVQVGTPVTVLP